MYKDEDGVEITILTDDELAKAFEQFVNKIPPVLQASASLCDGAKKKVKKVGAKGLKCDINKETSEVCMNSPIRSTIKCKFSQLLIEQYIRRMLIQNTSIQSQDSTGTTAHYSPLQGDSGSSGSASHHCYDDNYLNSQGPYYQGESKLNIQSLLSPTKRESCTKYLNLMKEDKNKLDKKPQHDGSVETPPQVLVLEAHQHLSQDKNNFYPTSQLTQSPNNFYQDP